MGVITLLLAALTGVSFAYLLMLSLRLHRQKPADLTWRGLIKLVSLGGVPASISDLYPRWFRAFWVFYLITCLTVAFAVWGTDHSFLVVIFPLLFYYFFVRYFLWEKQDLAD